MIFVKTSDSGLAMWSRVSLQAAALQALNLTSDAAGKSAVTLPVSATTEVPDVCTYR
jgi:hypothetical protein